MNTQIIAIANQKGGVGKTTTCANLGIGLAQAGKKVLLIDGDPQGSLTISLGHPQPDKLPFTLSDAMGRILMDEPLRPGEGILHHPEGVDLMPADIQLSGMEVSLVNAMSRETILRQYLDTLKGQYSHIQTGENSFGYIANWSQGKELPELRASLETINKAAGELIADIDRHYKVICKERGIDLAAQSEQTVPQQEAASEAEVPMQAPARHAYKLHSNFERTSPADSTYIQEYTVADDLSLIPGEVLYAGTYDECVKLHNALQDGSMTAEQVKAQAQAEKLYELDGRLYLHVQPCDGGYDYTIYDKGTMRALDGGQLDAPELPLSTAALKICEMHDMGGQSIQYAPLSMIETLQEAAVQQMQAAAQAAAPETTMLPDAPEQHLDEYPMPDPTLTQDDLEKSGYLDGDLLPLSKERAYELMERDLTVYIVQQGENPAMAFDTTDLDAYDGIFAVTREEWEESPAFDAQVKERMDHQQEREQAFLDHKGDCFAIYQVKHTDELRDIRYEGLEWLKSIGQTAQRDNYDLVYTAPLLPSDLKGDTAEQLFYLSLIHI